MKLRLPTKAEVVAVLCVAIWGYWLGWAGRYTHEIYLLDGRSQYWIVLIACVLGICAAYASWRRDRHATGIVHRLKTVAAAFLCVTALVCVTCWNIPKILVASTLHQRVSETYPFRMAYPGPSCGKNCRCKAGVIYYDPYLKQEIEFCHWDDASSFFYTDAIRVDKLISTQGAKILSHEAIH